MARLNSPLPCGDPTSEAIMIAPADSPKIVTLFGSPPKAPMLRLTKFSAATASIIP
jgi:hypothetical protein